VEVEVKTRDFDGGRLVEGRFVMFHGHCHESC
jgi:hypothetical protein